MGRLADLFERDLAIRGYSPTTRRSYLNAVRQIAKHFKRPPDELTLDEINDFQHVLARRRISWSYFNVIVCAARFFYNRTLKKGWNLEMIPYGKAPRRLPEILAAEEVIAIIQAMPTPKHRAILMTMYAAGLRVSEALHLRVPDIDSKRMVIRVDQGKGRKDRYTMLSPALLTILREWWKIARPTTWLFPHRYLDKPITPQCMRDLFVKACAKAGIKKPVQSHSLRHAFATHLLERGVNIRVIQTLLGHRSLRSTEIYTHVSKKYLQETPSPFDQLPTIPGLLPGAPKPEEPK